MSKKWPTVKTEESTKEPEIPWIERYPIHAACEGQQLASFVGLLDRASTQDLELIDDQGWAPIHYASFVGAHEIVALLCEKKVNLCSKIPNGSTPLHIAAGADYPLVVQTILQHIDNLQTLTMLNDEKQTPVQLCKMINSPNCAECIDLIEQKVIHFEKQ